jgi:hypothetical protein
VGLSSFDSKKSSKANLSAATNGTHTPTTTGGQGKNTFEEYDEFDEPGAEQMEMTFDISFRDPPTPVSAPPTSKSPLPLSPLPTHPDRSGTSSPWEATPIKSPAPWDSAAQTAWDDTTPAERPPLRSAKTEPHPSSLDVNNLGHNAWVDEFEEDFGTEKEVKMSFM